MIQSDHTTGPPMQRDQRKRQELGKPERATVPSPRAAGDEVSVDRDRLLNDILNTGVMGALIGGFALSNLQLNYDTAKTVEVAIYLTSFIGVHACTCSCVTSAMLCESDLCRPQQQPSQGCRLCASQLPAQPRHCMCGLTFHRFGGCAVLRRQVRE